MQLIRDLSKTDQFMLLMNNKMPLPKYTPAKPKPRMKQVSTQSNTQIDNARRNFNPKSVLKHGEPAKHMHYSQSLDKVFCLSCSLFARPEKSSFEKLDRNRIQQLEEDQQQ